MHFCDAVVLSILLSLLVDIFDNKVRRAKEREEEEQALLLRRGVIPIPEQDQAHNVESMEVDTGRRSPCETCCSLTPG